MITCYNCRRERMSKHQGWRGKDKESARAHYKIMQSKHTQKIDVYYRRGIINCIITSSDIKSEKIYGIPLAALKEYKKGETASPNRLR